MFKRLVIASAALVATLGAGVASAVVITADSSWAGQGSVTVSGTTISAYNNTTGTPGLIGVKDIPGIGTGAGVQGQGNDEIDWYAVGTSGNSEVLRFSFDTASVIQSLQLGLLFDGPEYADYQEAASFAVTYADSTKQVFTLQAMFPGTYAWNGLGAWVGAGLNAGQAGLWTGFNPFGSQAVTQIDFFATKGTCGTTTACTDQSDYVFRSLTTNTVPEPGTLTLFGIGLLGAGLAGRRRKAQAK